MNLDLQQILEELKEKGIVDQNCNEISPLSESGNSKVFGITCNGEYEQSSMSPTYKYVVKVHKPSHVQAEATFLKKYQKNPLTPQLLYVDPGYKFLVYHYIQGKRVQSEIEKRVWMRELIQLYINDYIS